MPGGTGMGLLERPGMGKGSTLFKAGFSSSIFVIINRKMELIHKKHKIINKFFVCLLGLLCIGCRLVA